MYYRIKSKILCIYRDYAYYSIKSKNLCIYREYVYYRINKIHKPLHMQRICVLLNKIPKTYAFAEIWQYKIQFHNHTLFTHYLGTQRLWLAARRIFCASLLMCGSFYCVMRANSSIPFISSGWLKCWFGYSTDLAELLNGLNSQTAKALDWLSGADRLK